MAALTIVDADVSVNWDKPHEPLNSVAAVAITAAQPIRLDTAGDWVLANATDAASLGLTYLASKAVASGEALTGIRYGQINLGVALAALAFGAPVYVSDTPGTLATTAGTVSKVAGNVMPAQGSGNVTADKMLLVDLR